jgi:hypothetical protein
VNILNANKLTSLLTVDFVEQDYASKINNHSHRQEIPNIVWDMKVQHIFHKGLPLLPNLRHLSPGHTLPASFIKMHFNNIIPFVSGS